MMRKASIIIFMTLALLMAMGSCRHRSVVTEMGIQFDTLHADTTAMLIDSGMSPCCHVGIHLITLKGDTYRQVTDSLLRSGVLQPDYLSLTDQKLSPRQAVDSFMQRYVGDYRDFYSNIFTAEPDTASLSISFDLDTEIEEGYGNVLCHLSHIKNRQGNLRTDYTLIHNIDVVKQKLLSLEDVFVPGYSNSLHDAILRQFEKQFGVKGISGLREAGYFVNSDIYAPNNFKLGSKSVTFVYVTGEIADRSKGEIQVDVKYSDLKRIMSL